MSYRLRNIAIALALAVIAALLVTFYVSNYRRNVQQGEETVKVYVAAKDIVAGTSGSDVVEGGLLKTQDVARRNVAPGAISSPGQIEKLVAADPIYAGEQVTTRRFTTVEEKGIRSQITGNLRAFQVPGDQHQLLAGTLKAGDHVDVVASVTYKVKVAERGRKLGRDRDRARRVAASSCATSSCSRPRRRRRARARSRTRTAPRSRCSWPSPTARPRSSSSCSRNGEWSLQLRPADDPADSPESVETVESVLGDGLKREQLEQLVFGFSGTR